MLERENGTGVKESKEEKFSSDLILDLYANLMMEIWEIVSSVDRRGHLRVSFLL